ncbi:MAG: hypothetical protein DMF72_15010 [Acidobacteria bacterium]|nr:MAG: hypothetical protein DMF72_15010 [Acidobacteriota bacterium]
MTHPTIENRLLWLASLCLLLYPLSSQGNAQSVEQALKKIVESFEMSDTTLPLALQRLAAKYHLLVGLEILPDFDGAAKKTITVKVHTKTVRELLDALVKADSRYLWTTVNQSVDVFPATGTDPLLQVRLPRFRAEGVDRNEAVDVLLNSPEIQPELTRALLRRREVMSLPADAPRVLSRFSLDVSYVTVREILNQIVAASHSSFWSFVRYGQQRQFFSVKVR